MRNWVFLLTGLLVFSGIAFTESYRKTASDVYTESYTAAMRRQTGGRAVEFWADQYRSMYEICDEHHNCTNVTAGEGAAERSADTARSQKQQADSMKPFIHVPVWF